MINKDNRSMIGLIAVFCVCMYVLDRREDGRVQAMREQHNSMIELVRSTNQAIELSNEMMMHVLNAMSDNTCRKDMSFQQSCIKVIPNNG